MPNFLKPARCLLLLEIMCLILATTPTLAQSRSLPISVPIHGQLIVTLDEQQTILIDTYTGEFNTVLQSDGDTIIRTENPVFSPQGNRFAYRNSTDGTGIIDLTANQEQRYEVFTDREGVYRILGWSNDQMNILYLNGTFVTLNPPVGIDWLDLLDLRNGSIRSLRNFEQYQLYKDVPLPIGMSEFRYEAVPNAVRNPVYDDWIAIQLRGSNPAITRLNPDTGMTDEERVTLSYLWNFQTNQYLVLDGLFPNPINEYPFLWSQDGKQLLAYTEERDIPRRAVIFDFEQANEIGTVKARFSVESGGPYDHWLGAGNLLLADGTDRERRDTVYYLGQLSPDGDNYTEFFRIPTNILPNDIGAFDWHITATEAEKQTLTCLFDQSLATRLQIGLSARVSFTDGAPISLRASYGTDAQEIARLPEGTTAEVIAGPACADGYRWWQLQLSDGTSGWVVEAVDGEQTLIPTSN